MSEQTTKDTPQDDGGNLISAESSSAAATTTTAAPTLTTTQATAGPSNILPAAHWAQVPRPEADEEDDQDSTFGDGNASSTASVSASILEYRTVHGRRFHSEIGNAQSWNPNDAQHDESMDLLHHVSTLLLDGKLCVADISESVKKVLDVGCGTGIWAIDFADQYPDTQVVGVDISPEQPQWIPPNLKFEVDDVSRPWTYEPNSFDYIHMRWLIGAFPDWSTVCKEVFKALKPGGVFESQEASPLITSDDGTVGPGSALNQWGEVFFEAGRKSGRSFRTVEDELPRKGMEEAGFVDFKEYNYKTPLGKWPADPKMREVGQFNQLALEQDIEGFVMYMWTSVMGWSKDEVQVYAAHLRGELKSSKHHPYYPQKIVIARKPEDA